MLGTVDEKITIEADETISSNEYIYLFETEEAMVSHARILQFGNKDEDKEIKQKIQKLSEYDQQIVIHAILNITNDKDFVGFNLKQIIEGMAVNMLDLEENSYQLKLTMIAKLLSHYQCKLESWQEEAEYMDIYKQLTNFCFRRVSTKPKVRETFLQLLEFLCVLMGLSINVLLTGRGECYTIPKHSKDTINQNADILFSIWKEETKDIRSSEEVDVYKIYQKAGIPVERKYAVIKYSGRYQSLHHQKSVGLSIVKQLVQDLTDRPSDLTVLTSEDTFNIEERDLCDGDTCSIEESNLYNEDTLDIEENDPCAEMAFKDFLEKIHFSRE